MFDPDVVNAVGVGSSEEFCHRKSTLVAEMLVAIPLVGSGHSARSRRMAPLALRQDAVAGRLRYRLHSGRGLEYSSREGNLGSVPRDKARFAGFGSVKCQVVSVRYPPLPQRPPR